MAPEVTLSLPYNEQADVFSLGTVIWELLSRKTIGAAVLSGERAWVFLLLGFFA